MDFQRDAEKMPDEHSSELQHDQKHQHHDAIDMRNVDRKHSIVMAEATDLYGDVHTAESEC